MPVPAVCGTRMQHSDSARYARGGSTHTPYVHSTGAYDVHRMDGRCRDFSHTGSSGGSGFCAPSDRHSSDSTRHDSSKMVRFDFDSYHEFPRDVRDRTPRATRRGSPLSLAGHTGRAVRRSIISTDLREFRRRPPWPSAPDPVRLWAVARMAKFVDMPLSVALADVGSLTLSACRDGFARREGDTARRSTLRGGSARHVGRPVRASEVGVAALYAGPHDAGPLERLTGGPSASTSAV